MYSLVSSLNKLRECRFILLLLVECGVAIINTCSPINIYMFAFISRFFVSFSLAFSSFSSSSFVCLEFLSAISQKFKQESIEIYFLFMEKIFSFYICFFLFAFIVPLFYTEKGNCFSLTRFTTFYLLSLSDSNF